MTLDSADFRTYTPSDAAAAIAAHLQDAVRQRGAATLAIPGGRSPGPALTALAAVLQPEVLANLSLLWVDERALAAGHADRNDGATLAAWRAGGELPARVYPMPAEMEDLEAAAAAYARTLAAATRGVPLDVCLLGIGEDGHVASLFPAHPGLGETRPVFAVYDSPKPPPKRLTLSLPVLRAATCRVVLALGAAKMSVAEAAREGPRRSIPVSLLPPEGTIWFTSPESA